MAGSPTASKSSGRSSASPDKRRRPPLDCPLAREGSEPKYENKVDLSHQTLINIPFRDAPAQRKAHLPPKVRVQKRSNLHRAGAAEGAEAELRPTSTTVGSACSRARGRRKPANYRLIPSGRNGSPCRRWLADRASARSHRVHKDALVPWTFSRGLPASKDDAAPSEYPRASHNPLERHEALSSSRSGSPTGLPALALEAATALFPCPPS
jgi:hypothetical protein